MAVSYRPIRKLASGGMADVYLGVQISDTGFSRLCAIKQIQKASEADENFISMFEDEAKICQTLQQANIVQVIDFTAIENGCALIMEYVQGVNLTALLRNHREEGKRLPLSAICFIGAEVAKGLHFVHSRTDPLTEQNLGIVHRDISPSNILLSSDGEVKITDFGIAKASNNSHETQVGVVKGKYQYMSPEQFNAREVDHRTDIYSLGVMLWEASAGRKMYAAANEVELLRKVAAGLPTEKPSDFNEDVDADFEEILFHALEVDMPKRYQSAGELASDLMQYVAKRFGNYTSLDLGKYINDSMEKEIESSKQLVKEVLEVAKNNAFEDETETEILVTDSYRENQVSGLGHSVESLRRATGAIIKDPNTGEPLHLEIKLSPDQSGAPSIAASGSQSGAVHQLSSPPNANRGVTLELENSQPNALVANSSQHAHAMPAPVQNPQMTQPPQSQHIGWAQAQTQGQIAQIKIRRQSPITIAKIFQSILLLIILTVVTIAGLRYGAGIEVERYLPEKLREDLGITLESNEAEPGPDKPRSRPLR